MPSASLNIASVATELSAESQIAELLSEEVGQTSEYEMQVLHTEIVEYTYLWKGKDVQSEKLILLLQTHIPAVLHWRREAQEARSQRLAGAGEALLQTQRLESYSGASDGREALLYPNQVPHRDRFA